MNQFRGNRSAGFGATQAASLGVAGLFGAAWLAGTAESHFNFGRDFDSQSGVARAMAVTLEAISPSASAPAAWDLPNLDHERVDYWVHKFNTDLRDDFTVWLSRTGKYGPMILQKLEERGMPSDLLYLAMIESGLNPIAYSHAHASGMWQFISETGRRYGLTINGVVDDRRDPVKATDAALDYLTYLHDRFDSWYLAAAGYNSGENRVGRIMRELYGSEKGPETAYYKIWPRLPSETRDYVPLMIAAARIAKEPAKYGFEQVELLPPLAYEEVPVDGGTPLAVVAEAAGVDASEVAELNHHLKLGRTPTGKRTMVRLPQGTRTAFLVNWPEVREKRTLALTEYRVRRGDSLIAIARSHGVTVGAIRSENAIRGSRIYAGQTIRIPTSG
ncbi:MAG: transglycosylase SLT domain-containing protein [Longimicrobiaceae bacterium]